MANVCCHPNLLMEGQCLCSERNDMIRSNNGRYFLCQQRDSNLVLYDRKLPIWSNGMWNCNVECTKMKDGILVSYQADGTPCQDKTPVWASGTECHAGSYLILQDDGRLVIFNSNKCAVWTQNMSNLATVRLPWVLSWVILRRARASPLHLHRLLLSGGSLPPHVTLPAGLQAHT